MEKIIFFTISLVFLCACLNQGPMQTTSTSTSQPELTGSFETWPKVNLIPRVNNASIDRFKRDFGVEPKQGMIFTAPQQNTRYVNWPMEILEVRESEIIFRYSPHKNTTIETIFGKANITTNETHILIFLPAKKNQVVDTIRGEAEVLDVTKKAIFLHFPQD